MYVDMYMLRCQLLLKTITPNKAVGKYTPKESRGSRMSGDESGYRWKFVAAKSHESERR